MSLTQLLSEPDVSVPQLFQQPDILNQIKYKIQIFVDFCKRNEDFTKIMITLGIKTPMYKNENMDMRRVSHVACDFLTCDHDQIAQLFVVDKNSQRIRCYSQDDDEIIQEIVSNQATGELVIADRKPDKQLDQFQQKYMYLNQLLAYVQQKYLDQNCINYMTKVLNTVIRVKPEQVYEYFTKKPDLLKKMIELTNYPSISYSLVKLVNEFQDQQFRSYKLQIINMVIKQILDKVSNLNFPVYLQFIEQVFDKNRHRSEEQDELKIVSQPLVSRDVITEMVNRVLSSKQSTIVSNSLLYLLKVIERMNIDEEKDPYSYTEQENPKPTMDFQVDQLFKNYEKLLGIVTGITRDKYSPNQILVFFDLLIKMSHHSRFKEVKIHKNKTILTLLKAFNSNESKYNGIIKNKIVLLLEILNRKQQASQCQQMNSEISQQVANIKIGHPQNVCFKQKLEMMLSGIWNSSMKDIQSKYSGLLAPTNFTQNRNLKIKQLEFVKKQMKVEEKQQNTQESSKQSNSFQFQIKNDHIPESNGDTSAKQALAFSTRNGGINLEALNGKINAIKNKKQHKVEQQLHRKKNDQAKTEVDKKQILNGSKSGEANRKAKKDQKQNQNQKKQGDQQKNKQKQAYSYYVKHLYLF